MKKSLIAVAVATAFAAPAAFAEVTISGAVNIGVAYIDSDDSVPTLPRCSTDGLDQNEPGDQLHEHERDVGR